MINEQESLRLKDEELEKKRVKLTQKSTMKVESSIFFAPKRGGFDTQSVRLKC